ncbi:MAG: plasmid mobilization protein, partial [Oscillospiraceae bacterium]
MRNRSNCVSIRYSDEEYKVLQEKIKESGQTKSAYIINATLNGKVSSADDVQEMKEQSKLLSDIYKQLRGMGTNLNQMAHVANGKGIIPSADKLREIERVVVAVKKEVDDIWQSTRQSIGRQNLKR